MSFDLEEIANRRVTAVGDIAFVYLTEAERDWLVEGVRKLEYWATRDAYGDIAALRTQLSVAGEERDQWKSDYRQARELWNARTDELIAQLSVAREALEEIARADGAWARYIRAALTPRAEDD